jgi:hypothetical protein
METLDFTNLNPQKTIELFLNIQKALRDELSTLELDQIETSEFLEKPFF